MSITGGRNPPIDKGGEIVGGGTKLNYSLSHPIALCVRAHKVLVEHEVIEAGNVLLVALDLLVHSEKFPAL
jgi:hypothetical protein